MGKPVKFVFNRAAFQEQVLKNEELQKRIMRAAEAATTDSRIMVREHNGSTRSGAALLCPAAVEAAHGTLTQTLGRIHVS